MIYAFVSKDRIPTIIVSNDVLAAFLLDIFNCFSEATKSLLHLSRIAEVDFIGGQVPQNLDLVAPALRPPFGEFSDLVLLLLYVPLQSIDDLLLGHGALV